MIRRILIENYKSLQQLELDLGRINVLIGENGCGKTNILEAIALGSAATSDKLDNEFLASRGIRVTEPRLMRAAFGEDQPESEVRILLEADDNVSFDCRLQSQQEETYWRWISLFPRGKRPRVKRFIKKGPIPEFLIYSPENTALRTFQSEGQILPMGIKGEGLFTHLKALGKLKDPTRLNEIMEKLALIDWFERFEIPPGLLPGERSIRIRDRYLAEGTLFDQRSANEGFLFLLFYFTLFISVDTPEFFAIDNVDASLNPKMCSTLLHELVDLANKHNKQAILTTHNPAVLDGLDLTDDSERLFVIYRNKQGNTKARRVEVPKPIEGEPPMRLSEAFLRGYIGGLPKNF